MILVKFQDTNGEYWSLRNIKGVILSLHNMNNILNRVGSQGWQGSLDTSGEKHLAIKIHGIVSGAQSEDILHEHAFHNSEIGCQVVLGGVIERKIDAKYIIELYEKHYDAGNLDHYTVRLLSSGKVSHSVLNMGEL